MTMELTSLKSTQSGFLRAKLGITHSTRWQTVLRRRSCPCLTMNPPLLPSTPTSRLAHAVRLACACLLGCGISLAALAQSGETNGATPSLARRGELITLVRQDCGSCHGLTLKGGLGPALLPETLRDKPVDSLKATILHGRPGTAMPPWSRFVNDAEAEWIVANLQKGLPSVH